MEQFARREGINRLTLAKWAHLQGRRRKESAVQFAEVKLGATAPARWTFELALPNGFVVRAAGAAALAQLLALVRRWATGFISPARSNWPASSPSPSRKTACTGK